MPDIMLDYSIDGVYMWDSFGGFLGVREDVTFFKMCADCIYALLFLLHIKVMEYSFVVLVVVPVYPLLFSRSMYGF